MFFPGEDDRDTKNLKVKTMVCNVYDYGTMVFKLGKKKMKSKTLKKGRGRRGALFCSCVVREVESWFWRKLER